jgi:hypothetical protein
MARDQLLVIDADLPSSLAGSLRKRGREAVSAAALELSTNVKDPELLRGLAARFNGKCPWVLVTGDDAMPAEHGPVILETEATIATIFPEYPEGVKEYEWYTDVTHRWAHAMQEQKPRSVRRYSFGGSKVWKPRRRHIRTIAKEGLTPWRREDAESAEAIEGAASMPYEVLKLPGTDQA